jgi:GNAT superfamily N-acetyltransferase
VNASPELREFAETPDRFTQLSADVERFADERACVVEGPTWAVVSGVRVEADAVESLLEEVRRRVPADRSVTWWMGPSTRPDDLHDRLEALGLVEPRDGATLLHALACVEPPPAASENVDVRPVETLAEHLAAIEVMWEAFGTPEERRERERPHLAGSFEAAQAAGALRTFLAWLDGQPVGVGRSVYSGRGVFLIAGAVAPAARGRGVYRALVRARWDDAVDRGTPALVTEAMPDTSLPILLRLGFQEVCLLRRLEDVR